VQFRRVLLLQCAHALHALEGRQGLGGRVLLVLQQHGARREVLLAADPRRTDASAHARAHAGVRRQGRR